MIGHRQLTIDDYLDILRRRRWLIVLPTLILPVVAYLISLKLPNLYTSQTLVLVEQQKVPDSFVKPVVTEDLTARLATMQEQILSRTQLQPIIERFSLYQADKGKVAMEDLVDRMRRSITIAPIRSDMTTRTGGLPGFYISFVGESPRQAHDVCAEVTSMFVTANLKSREQSAQGTTEFLSTQLDDAKRNLDDQDAKLAAFKRKYIGQLPDQEQSNLTMLGTLNSQLQAVTQNLTRAQQDKTYAESMLTQQRAAWQASLSTSNNPQNLEQQLAALQSQLISLQGKYTEDHPDVIKTKSEITQVKKKMAEADAAAANADKTSTKSAKELLNEPPQLQQLRLQIHQLDQMIAVASAEQQNLQKQIREYQSRIQLSPTVEEEYKKLTRDYDTAQKFYDEMLTKKTQSEMATDLERRQQGEQFRVIDPPSMPEKPTSPDRPMFAAGGLFGGLALGLGLAFLLEMRDKSLRNERDVEFFLELPTLALMPWVVDGNMGNGNGKKRFWQRKKPQAAESRLSVGA